MLRTRGSVEDTLYWWQYRCVLIWLNTHFWTDLSEDASELCFDPADDAIAPKRVRRCNVLLNIETRSLAYYSNDLTLHVKVPINISATTLKAAHHSKWTALCNPNRSPWASRHSFHPLYFELFQFRRPGPTHLVWTPRLFFLQLYDVNRKWIQKRTKLWRSGNRLMMKNFWKSVDLAIILPWCPEKPVCAMMHRWTFVSSQKSKFQIEPAEFCENIFDNDQTSRII